MGQGKLKIIVYGAESLGYKVPKTHIEESKYKIFFYPLDTDKDLSDFDLVIFFERTFERTVNSKTYCADKAEMLKRVKQLFKLYEKKVTYVLYSIRSETST